MRKSIAIGLLAIALLLPTGVGRAQSDPQLSISIADGGATITLQNSIYIVTMRTVGGGLYGTETNMQDVVLRSTGQDLAVYFDANAFRGYTISATITRNLPDEKTVRCVFTGNYYIVDFTIYANRPEIRIDHVQYSCPSNGEWGNMVDLFNLSVFQSPEFRAWNQENFFINYPGGAQFRPLQYVNNTTQTCAYWDIYEQFIPNCAIDYAYDPANGGALSYFGNMIMAYGEPSGKGMVRIMPFYVPGTRGGLKIIKFLKGPGFEGFEPYHSTWAQSDRPPFTGWIIPFSSGLANAMAYAQTVVDAAVLPVQIASFSGSVINTQGHVQLDWVTLSETNNFGFEVQKSANNTTGFQTIANSFVPGHGTTLERQSYRYVDVTAGAGVWYYRLKQMDLDGTVNYSDPILPTGPNGVAADQLPAGFTLDQNYPNPFNPSTVIAFSLPSDDYVRLDVLNTMGQRVATVLDGQRSAGRHTATFAGENLASGTYVYRLTTSRGVLTRKMLLLR